MTNADYPRRIGRRDGRYLARAARCCVRTMRRSRCLAALRGLLCAACSCCSPAAPRRATACAQMQVLADARAAAPPAACWSSTPKAAKSSARSAAGTPALARLEHEAVHDLDGARAVRARSADPDQGLRRRHGSTPTASSTAASTCRAAATRPSARPAFYDTYLAGLGTNLFALRPQIRAGRDHARSPAASTPTTRSSTACAASPTPATRPAPYIGPLSGPRLQLRLRRHDQLQRLLLRPGEAGGARRSPARCATPGITVSPQVALGKTPAERRSGSRVIRSPAADPDRQHDRRLLRQLLRRDADEAARRPLRRRRHAPPPAPRWSSDFARNHGSGVHAVDGSGLTRSNRASPAARSSTCCWRCASEPGRRRLHPGPGPRRPRRARSPTACTAPPPTAAAGRRPAP